jgi:hypothetical protein
LQVKPGCILRRSNFNVLERENLVTGKQVCLRSSSEHEGG